MNNKKRACIMFTIIALLLVSIVSVGGSHMAPNAFNGCADMGSSMDVDRVSPGTTFFSGVVKPDKPNRKWTVEELFRKSTVFTSYNGEGPGNWFYADKVDRGQDRVGEERWNAEGVQDRLTSARGIDCFVGRGDIVSVGIFKLSGGIVNLISMTVSGLIGNDFMVDGLVKIVGGDGTNSGLITTFVNSIYMPLVVIALILTAVVIAYKGLIQMKFREAISAAIWTTLSFVIGLSLMFNPEMLAGIPQTATSVITTCVVGALNGENCLSGDVTTPNMLTGAECKSYVQGDSDSADMMVNGMNCTIWKTFVLEPWAEEQFGVPYNDLYTKNPPEGGSIWSNLPEGEADKYCVNLASTKSADDLAGKEVVMDLNDDSTVCNVALYQLYIKTKMKDTVNHSGDEFKLTEPEEDGDKYDARWYDIIVPMAGDDTNWSNWSGGGHRFIGRFATSLMGLTAVIAASTVLFVLAVFGGAYKITGVILMAFAPLFLLFALEPTRGRRIFLGWLETLVSSILKYFAITLLIIISLVMYAGVLSNTSGVSSLIAVIVLTAALLMYRKEIIDLIGASNMGGQRLSNKVNDGIEGLNKQAKEKGRAVVGGSVGGAVGALSNRNQNRINREDTLKNLRENLSNSTSEEEKITLQNEIYQNEAALNEEKGLKSAISTAAEGSAHGRSDSLGRAMRRGTSATSTAFKQMNATKNELAKDNKVYDGVGGAGVASAKSQADNSDNNPDNNNDVGGRGTKPEESRATGEATVDNQREHVEYKGDLSSEEKSHLNKFADDLKDITNSEELLGIADNPDIQADKNKKALVANEINARLKLNSINGIASGALSRHALADNDNISNEELAFNVQMHRDNFIETGDEAEFDKYEAALRDSKRRIDGEELPEDIAQEHLNATRQTRERSKEAGLPNMRSVPTEKELRDSPNKDILNGVEVTTPSNLAMREIDRKLGKTIKPNMHKGPQVAGMSKDETNKDIIRSDRDKRLNKENSNLKDKLANKDGVLPDLETHVVDKLDNNNVVSDTRDMNVKTNILPGLSDEITSEPSKKNEDYKSDRKVDLTSGKTSEKSPVAEDMSEDVSETIHQNNSDENVEATSKLDEATENTKGPVGRAEKLTTFDVKTSDKSNDSNMKDISGKDEKDTVNKVDKLPSLDEDRTDNSNRSNLAETETIESPQINNKPVGKERESTISKNVTGDRQVSNSEKLPSLDDKKINNIKDDGVKSGKVLPKLDNDTINELNQSEPQDFNEDLNDKIDGIKSFNDKEDIDEQEVSDKSHKDRDDVIRNNRETSVDLEKESDLQDED